MSTFQEIFFLIDANKSYCKSVADVKLIYDGWMKTTSGGGSIKKKNKYFIQFNKLMLPRLLV